MSSVNKVFIMGRLGQDPEVRYTQNKIPVATLNVATTEFWTKEGQRQEQTEWHRIVVWNRQAENCAKYLSKGRMVFIEGRLQTRSWEDKNGQKRFTTEINASNVQFVGGNAGRDGMTAGGMGTEEPPLPGQDSFHSGSNGSSVDLDDIPF